MVRAIRWAGMALLAMMIAGCSSLPGGTAITAPAVTALSPTVPSVPGSTASTYPTTPTTPTSSSPPASGSVPTVTVPTVTVPTVTVPRTSAPAPPATTTAPAPRSTTARPSTKPSTKPSAQPAAFPVCPAVPPADTARVVDCLRRSVSNFWSGELNQVVDQPVVVEPATAAVPVDCRGGLTAAPAFTCQVNDTVYINQSLIALVTTQFGAKDVPYALASVVSHEIGHVVQAAVRQPGYQRTGTSDQLSQQIEQQADCLSGVWAHAEGVRSKLDDQLFARVADALITDISSNPEIATHGTPARRAAAIALGMRNGRPQDCSLATFS